MNELTITEYKDIRVLTTQQIAEAYGTDTNVITKNFNRNKERYTEGKHFIILSGDEKNDFVNRGQFDSGLKKAGKLYLWTEKGAFLHAKSLGTDEAWEVYERLVDFYFNKRKPLTAIEQIQLTQQAVIEVKDQIDSVNQDLQNFKREMPLLAIECQQITEAKNKKVVPLLGGKESNAYKNASLRGKVYRDLEGQLRREFGVTSYKAIHRNQTDKALQIISEYELPMCLQEQIDDENSQMNL